MIRVIQSTLKTWLNALCSNDRTLLYDPSYGRFYDNIADFEAKSIAFYALNPTLKE